MGLHGEICPYVATSLSTVIVSLRCSRSSKEKKECKGTSIDCGRYVNPTSTAHNYVYAQKISEVRLVCSRSFLVFSRGESVRVQIYVAYTAL